MFDRALKRLEALPDAGDGLINCPWSVASRPKLQDSDWAESTLKGFDIADLTATQDYLKRDTVRYHLEVLSKVTSGENINSNVISHDGVNKIYDGHHRLMAMMLLGAEQANCWVLEV